MVQIAKYLAHTLTDHGCTDIGFPAHAVIFRSGGLGQRFDLGQYLNKNKLDDTGGKVDRDRSKPFPLRSPPSYCKLTQLV